MTRRAWLLFGAVSLVWGVPYFFIKVAVEDGVPPAFVAWSRVALAAVILLPLAGSRGALRGLGGRWAAIGAYAACEVAVPFLLIAVGEQHISSSLAAILIASMPLMVAVLSVRFSPGRQADRPAAGRAVHRVRRGGRAARGGRRRQAGRAPGRRPGPGGHPRVRDRDLRRQAAAGRPRPARADRREPRAGHGGAAAAGGRPPPDELPPPGALGVAGRARRGLHRARAGAVLPAGDRGRAEPGRGHHLRQPAGGGRARAC